MANRNIMLSALKEHTFPLLKEQGFTGKYPNFRRKLDNCIELISFQTNKWGGSFTIEVSAIFPGSVNPNYTLYEGADALQQPVGRVGNPLDIANMVLFLCSEKAGFITGENICIDGGQTRLMVYHNDCGWSYNP